LAFFYELASGVEGVAVATPSNQSIPGDITGDGSVNVQDLLVVISAWGTCPGPCPPACAADIAPAGGNCTVNVQDLLFVISNWG
jgi:hypothetical protein